ncbi:MAG TPA: DUF4080 domain-containing protein [Kiritimatiellia bacterium]|nr:DUF4080 domain-containing protein [Kiritimatiellia bacterium]HRZ13256.1 DUF4080 domain-containing protein [Kiritimatiellia bacterium]HSA18705.1 DUF4080 domain-containing protein [Kiritimatiellia bacterium]
MLQASCDVLLCTSNARYIHPAFGLRCLLANLGPLQSRARLLESDIKTEPSTVAEAILAEAPRIVGLGAHVWNATRLADIAARLKAARPDLVLVLGGPELTSEETDLTRPADYIVVGEGEEVFRRLCVDLLEGRRPAGRFLRAAPVDLSRLALPYELYTDADLKHRITYVESSRGCPYHCDYCLSAGDAPVRYFPLPPLLDALDRLLDRGARTLKFVDRTFNLDLERCCALLAFFLERMRPGLFVHFEMVPDRFPDELRGLLARFPTGSLQLEIGVQTFNPEVAARIRRPLRPELVEENLAFLRKRTNAILHTDLIAGLPGETAESFAAGFDRLARLDPHKIQIGILKRLPGAPLARHDGPGAMRYNPRPPYEILSTSAMKEAELIEIKRFARFWERVVNRGHFPRTAPLLWAGAASPYRAFAEFSRWLFARFGRDYRLPLTELADALFEFLTEARGLSRERTATSLLNDYREPGRKDTPRGLRPYTARG